MEFDYETVSGETIQVVFTGKHYQLFNYKGEQIKKSKLTTLDIKNIEEEIENQNNYEDMEEETGYYEEDV